MRVFISSVVQGMKRYRDAASDAVDVLGHEPVRAEDFVASHTSPRDACLDAVRKSDALVLLLGTRYGEVQQSGISATHEEYREARKSHPILVMVENAADFEPQQKEFLNEVQDWQKGHYTNSFSKPTELRDAVIRALHNLEISQAVGAVDSSEILDLALESIVKEEGYRQSGPQLAVTVASGPIRDVLRPGQLESSNLQRDLIKAAMFGSDPVFRYTKGTQPEINGSLLKLGQGDRVVWLQEDGTIDFLADLPRLENRSNVIVEEDVQELIEAFICFAAGALDLIDESRRLSHSVVVASLLHARQASWITRADLAEISRSGIFRAMNRITYNQSLDPVHLSPPEKPRTALAASSAEIAEDLTVLLRRSIDD